MKITKALLYVENETINLRLDVLDALQIIDAASDNFTICGNAGESIINFKEIIGRINANKVELEVSLQSGLQTLDKFKLDEEILIVTIGKQSDLKIYIANRIKHNSGEFNWHVINSTYARLGYLSLQKSLSDYIPADTANWLKIQIKKFGASIFNDCLKTVKNSSVLILGETIIDEYIYCDALGRVTKDPLIAFEKRSHQNQVGGVLAVAKHFSGLGVNANVISKWSDQDNDFVVSELKSSKGLNLYNLGSNNSIRKTRFVDKASNARVFETYELPTELDYGAPSQEITELVKKEKINFDQVIIMDYGHYFFNHNFAQDYLQFSVPVAVNTQSNAGNRGFNPISNYIGSDYVFLNGSEVQVEMRNRVTNVEDIVPELGLKLGCKELYVTNGSAGIVSWSLEEGVIVAPTFSPTIIDRTGAGDALLAAISSLRMKNVPIEIATFFGNIAGSLLVGALGNERSITLNDLEEEANKIISKVTSI